MFAQRLHSCGATCGIASGKGRRHLQPHWTSGHTIAAMHSALQVLLKDEFAFELPDHMTFTALHTCARNSML